MELEDVGMCFACGPNNPIGLKLTFSLEDGKYITRFTPRREHQGYDGITHGGIVSTVLDEVMARLVYHLGYHAVTVDLRVRMKKPAAIGEELTVIGWIESEKHGMLDCAAEARNPKGELVAQAQGRMMKI